MVVVIFYFCSVAWKLFHVSFLDRVRSAWHFGSPAKPPLSLREVSQGCTEDSQPQGRGIFRQAWKFLKDFEAWNRRCNLIVMLDTFTIGYRAPSGASNTGTTT